jgi:hypothetical protein
VRVWHPDVAESAAHLFDKLHLLDGQLQRVGRRPHGIDRRMTRRFCLIPSRFGGGSRDLSSVPSALAVLPKALALLAEGLAGVTIVIATLATLLAQTSELFGRRPRRLG